MRYFLHDFHAIQMFAFLGFTIITTQYLMRPLWSVYGTVILGPHNITDITYTVISGVFSIFFFLYGGDAFELLKECFKNYWYLPVQAILLSNFFWF